MTLAEQIKAMDEVYRDLMRRGGPQKPSTAPRAAPVYVREEPNGSRACLLREQQRLIREWSKK